MKKRFYRPKYGTNFASGQFEIDALRAKLGKEIKRARTDNSDLDLYPTVILVKFYEL